MEQLAEEVKAQKIESLLIYTNEAHPSEIFPHHTSFAQKLAHAKSFQENFHIRRPLLVDSLDGVCHRAYGSMPNMTWIFDKLGRPIYKANWTSLDSVKSALQTVQEMVARRRATQTGFTPFEVHRLEYRAVDRRSVLRGLERSGARAVAEYRAQSERWGRELPKD